MADGKPDRSGARDGAAARRVTRGSRDGRAEEATAETWGGQQLAIEYDLAGHSATVTDRRGSLWQYQHN